MNKSLKFSKMQGAGNDFVIVDARSLDMDWKSLAVNVCRYHFGVGADGFILVMNSSEADLKMRVFNTDGSEPQICGNGLGCFAKFAVDRGIVSGPSLSVETPAGVKIIETSQKAGKVASARVNMGQPRLKTADVPVAIVMDGPVLDHSLKFGSRTLKASAVSMGNPHAVCFIDEKVESFPLSEIGPLMEHHKLFPQRTNFEVVNVVDEGTLRARVWERGVGETLACGSGACAAAIVAHLKRTTKDIVDIILPGGTLTVTWDGKSDVFLEVPMEEVFTGEYLL
jgi:diaminopimelate epimerase